MPSSDALCAEGRASLADLSLTQAGADAVIGFAVADLAAHDFVFAS